MWSRSYFGGNYFAPFYWPQSAGEPPAIGGIVCGSFSAVARMSGSFSLIERVSGSMAVTPTVSGTVGVENC